MRDVKFRGWDSENKKWRYGHFFETVEGIMRCYNIVENREVKFYCSPQSIGQFTGKQDRNGKDIYEKNVIDKDFVVLFENCNYILKNISNNDIMPLYEYWRLKNGKIKITEEFREV